jgi:photosystem II stability/assembly factor-like uncharacterized protein
VSAEASARRLRAAAVIAAGLAALAGASLAYLWPVLTHRVAAAPPPQVQLLAASFLGPDAGWILIKDSATPNGTTAIFRTEDGGRHWTPLPIPLEKSYALLLQFFDGSRGVLLLLRDEAGGRPRLFATGSGGAGWHPLTLPVEGGAPAGVAAFSGADRGWFLLPRTGGASRLWRTRDGARTWQELTPPDLTGGQASLVFFDPDHGLLSGGAIWATADGGDSWRVLPEGVPIGAGLGPAAVQGAELRAAVRWPGGAAVAVSHDGGAAWKMVPLPVGGTVRAVGLGSVLDWYVAAGDLLLASHDGGASWATARPRLPRGVALGALTMRGAAGWSLGSAGTDASVLLRTTNGGQDWSPVALPRLS